MSTVHIRAGAHTALASAIHIRRTGAPRHSGSDRQYLEIREQLVKGPAAKSAQANNRHY
jgi:hypothetical protein